MRIIKLSAIDSTNSYLRRLGSEFVLDDYTIVSAEKQTEGRGQMGAVWDAEGSKNLTFSVFKDMSMLELDYPFLISIVASLSVFKALEDLNIPKLSVKWPNDILSANKKICGILIESVIKRNRLKSSIVGIGLNVNQTVFNNFTHASSLTLITGQVFDLEILLLAVIEKLKAYFCVLENGEHAILTAEYEKYLFRKDKPSSFKDAKGQIFTGIIKRVSPSGHLQVLVENRRIKEFDIKEITLLY
ncbi:biotin--[acetyl-CoA-carboxylase] ligase [Mariniflexile ostreae]|uniref:Biotin--[acetyl-CoA-carboxylase] ligase n=1 Tax=Mariniflexile ostreae TaxID=1520892 RepID=A0ABV5F8S2_9FLAO